jgi:biotin carboxyl carrier protein
MRRFLIKVNGKDYDVCVEEIGAGAPAAPAAVASAPVAAPAPAPTPAAAESAAPAPAAAPAVPAEIPADGTKTEAPMPGNIIEVRANVGDTVAEGDVVIILEAMKLENEIMAPCAGKILSVNVSKGDMVNSGDILFVVG